MLHALTPKQIEQHNQRKAFQAKIAARAAIVQVRSQACQSYSIPNAPYGVRKPGVKTLPSTSKRYIQPAQFTVSYEAAWMLEICGIEETEIFSSKVLMDTIKRAVAAFYQISLTDLISNRRTARVIMPRQVAMYLCKVMTTRSLPEIGRVFNGKDHTTILHAVRKIAALIETDRQLATVVSTLKNQCGGGVDHDSLV